MLRGAASPDPWWGGGRLAAPMRLSPPQFSSRAMLAFGCMTCIAVAQSGGRNSLVDHSPFGAPAASAASVPSAELELRGVVWEGGKILVSVFDASTKTSRWLAVGDRDPDLEVVSYDEIADIAHVQLAGRPLTLSLRNRRATAVEKFTVLIL